MNHIHTKRAVGSSSGRQLFVFCGNAQCSDACAYQFKMSQRKQFFVRGGQAQAVSSPLSSGHGRFTACDLCRVRAWLE
jgi:hypothetical protein